MQNKLVESEVKVNYEVWWKKVVPGGGPGTGIHPTGGK